MEPNDHASAPPSPGEGDRSEPSEPKEHRASSAGTHAAPEADAKAKLDADAKAKKPARKKNNLRKVRIERMMSKAELARRANLSVLTVDRIEKGFGCRMDTKRKILEALGLTLPDRIRVFGEDE